MTSKINVNLQTSGNYGEVLMKVNGVTMELFTLATIKNNPDLLDERKHSPELFIPMGNGWYWFRYDSNRSHIYYAAGYDLDKMDFDVPSGWLRLPEQQRRYAKGDRAVWSYEGNDNHFGKPIWDSEAMDKVKAIVKGRLAKRKRK